MTKTCDKPGSFCSHCAKRAAVHDCRGKVAEVIVKGVAHLWPPNPNPESWESDTPNEGLWIVVEPDADGIGTSDGCVEIVDSFADYHGFFIVEPTNLEVLNSCFAVRPSFVPTTDPQYLAAYRAILEAFEANWHHPVGPKGTWVACCHKLIASLLAMGWAPPDSHPLCPADSDYWGVKT